MENCISHKGVIKVIVWGFTKLLVASSTFLYYCFCLLNLASMLLSHLNAMQYSLLCCQYCRIWMCHATVNSVILLSRNTRICKIGSIIFDNLVWLASFLRLVVRLWNWTVVYMLWLLGFIEDWRETATSIWDDSRFLNMKNGVPGVFHWLGISTEISYKAVILGHLHGLAGGGHEIWVSNMKCLPLRGSSFQSKD